MSSSTTLIVQRNVSELITPATPTPYELKKLSNLDKQRSLRKYNSNILFYQNSDNMVEHNPVKVIKLAIGVALVHYYPLAGRLKEENDGNLVVECSAKGVLFIEAKANMRLEYFGESIQPPFYEAESLFHAVAWSHTSFEDLPLLTIQVTVLTCGGFIIGISINHTLCDATGIVQFMTAVGDIARGLHVPSIKPVWEREILQERDPVQISCRHYVYYGIHTKKSLSLVDKTTLAKRAFLFPVKYIDSLKVQVPSISSNVDILMAILWKCRTVALNLDSGDQVRLAFAVNARSRFIPPLPMGYYGNAFGLPIVVSGVSELAKNPRSVVVDLIRRAKRSVTNEFMKSTIDFLGQKYKPKFDVLDTFHVSDLTKIGFRNIDFGWGEAEYGGPIWGGHPSSFLISTMNKKTGEEGIIVTINLPNPLMDRFVAELHKLMGKTGNVGCNITSLL